MHFKETGAQKTQTPFTENTPANHSEDEDHFVTFGVSAQGRLLTVSHTERGNSIPIISARLATNAERQIYEEVK